MCLRQINRNGVSLGREQNAGFRPPCPCTSDELIMSPFSVHGQGGLGASLTYVLIKML